MTKTNSGIEPHRDDVGEGIVHRDLKFHLGISLVKCLLEEMELHFMTTGLSDKAPAPPGCPRTLTAPGEHHLYGPSDNRLLELVLLSQRTTRNRSWELPS